MPGEPGPDPAGELTRIMRRVEQAFLFGVPGTTEAWLIRHGDCYQDMAETADPPLSSLGREQARLTGRYLEAFRFDVVWSSTLPTEYVGTLNELAGGADHVSAFCAAMPTPTKNSTVATAMVAQPAVGTREDLQRPDDVDASRV